MRSAVAGLPDRIGGLAVSSRESKKDLTDHRPADLRTSFPCAARSSAKMKESLMLSSPSWRALGSEC